MAQLKIYSFEAERNFAFPSIPMAHKSIGVEMILSAAARLERAHSERPKMRLNKYDRAVMKMGGDIRQSMRQTRGGGRPRKTQAK